MHKYTDFGTEIRVELARKGMRTTELCERVSERTGMYFDRSYLSRICRGKSHSPVIIQAIKKVLDINEVM